MEVRIDLINAARHTQHGVVDFLTPSQATVSTTHQELNRTILRELTKKRFLVFRGAEQRDRG